MSSVPVPVARLARRGLLAGAAMLGMLLTPNAGSGRPGQAVDAPPPRGASSVAAAADATRSADFDRHEMSSDVRRLAVWAAASGDNGGLAFVVIDKREARLHVFEADARPRGSTPVLLGLARGDHSVPGIGSRPIEDILPEERTTPAGRFVAERGHNLRGEDIVWVSYDDAISMHRVRATVPSERRLERLATPTIEDNRVSYGCINVPVAFYETHVHPLFRTQPAVVYVMPEVGTLQQAIPAYPDAASRRGDFVGPAEPGGRMNAGR